MALYSTSHVIAALIYATALWSARFTTGLSQKQMCAKHKWHYWNEFEHKCMPCTVCYGGQQLDRRCSHPVPCASISGPKYECPKLSSNFTCSPVKNRFYLGTECSGWCRTVPLTVTCARYPAANDMVWTDSRVNPCIVTTTPRPSEKPAAAASTLKPSAIIFTDPEKDGRHPAVLITVVCLVAGLLVVVVAVGSVYTLLKDCKGRRINQGNAVIEAEEEGALEEEQLLRETEIPAFNSREPEEHEEDSGLSSMGNVDSNSGASLDSTQSSVDPPAAAGPPAREPAEGAVEDEEEPSLEDENGLHVTHDPVEHPYSNLYSGSSGARASNNTDMGWYSSGLPSSLYSDQYSTYSPNRTASAGDAQLCTRDSHVRTSEPRLELVDSERYQEETGGAAGAHAQLISDYSDGVREEEEGEEEEGQTSPKTVSLEPEIDAPADDRDRAHSFTLGSECSLPEQISNEELWG